MGTDTDWLHECLKMIKDTVERLDRKFDQHCEYCNRRFEVLERSRSRQAGFVAGVTLVILGLMKLFTWLAQAFAG